jgi:heptosyltransferase-2
LFCLSGMTSATEKVLIVGPSWVGDMVMSQVLYRTLQQTRPGVILDVLAPAWSESLVKRMPEVRRSIVMPLGHGELELRRRRCLGQALQDEKYSQAIVLPNSLKSALIPWFAHIPRRTGWRGEMRYGLLNDLRVLNASAVPLLAQRYLALGLPPATTLPLDLPEPLLQVDRAAAYQVARQFGLRPGMQSLALCPGAQFGEAKRWPAHYYADVARDYLSRGWQVVLFGSANDSEVCGQIHRDSGGHVHCHNLGGRTSLDEAVDLLSLSAAVISNDSGLMHIAAALQRPLLAIYGATSPGFTPPLSRSAAVLQSDIPCAPCFERECPLQHHRCMRDTKPAQLIARLDALLAIDSGEQ